MSTILNKWHRVDPYLRVAFETTLVAGTVPEYSEDFKEVVRRTPPKLLEDMIHKGKGEEVSDRYYHPRVSSFSDLAKPLCRVAFMRHLLNSKATADDKYPFTRLMLQRHAEMKGDRAKMWCGRMNEDQAFGFDTEGSRNPYFLPLSYPGKNGKFEPVYVKVVEEIGVAMPYYLLVGMFVEGVNVVVEVRKVESKSVPAFLRGEY